jgi:hypothetical protein
LKHKPPRNDRKVLGVVAILGGVVVAGASIAHVENAARAKEECSVRAAGF